MSEAKSFELSIVVAWQAAQPNIEDCLDSLYAQRTHHNFEVIVAYGGFKPSLEILSKKYSDLKILEHSESDSIPSLHGLGLAHAAGDLLAITEAHTTFSPDWVDTAVSVSSSNSDAAIGGVVEPGKNLTSVDYALYLCDYAQFALPLATGPSDDLPGNNIVFKRQIMDMHLNRTDLAKHGFWKTFFCNELMEKGEQLSRDSRLVAYYNRHLTFSEVMERRYHHGRCFGAMRSEAFNWSKRAIYAASCAALPAVLALRLFSKVRGKPALMSRFLKVQPICEAIICAWVYGEFVGTVGGAGDSCGRL
ncbi:MAG: glycosyltransferase [Candidatus Obscuribacterales bacterium]